MDGGVYVLSVLLVPSNMEEAFTIAARASQIPMVIIALIPGSIHKPVEPLSDNRLLLWLSFRGR